MIPATEEEKRHVIDYMASEAPDLTVEFLQKVYGENVVHVRHDVWDVHTNEDRWWVITGGLTNLYAQQQFPNMDYALTFHMGLCLRIPRSEEQKLSDLPVEPFAEAYRYLSEASEAFDQAQEVADYQAIGVRCREALLAFVAAALTVVPWSDPAQTPPKKADLKAWADHICSVALHGSANEYRRHLFKTVLDEAWRYANWLTHSKGTHLHDAEAAVAITESAISLATNALIRFMRKVPDECPTCGSHRLSPQRGIRTDEPDVLWERPTCDKCGWAGEPVAVPEVAVDPAKPRNSDDSPPPGDCVIPTVPLRQLIRPTIGSVDAQKEPLHPTDPTSPAPRRNRAMGMRAAKR